MTRYVLLVLVLIAISVAAKRKQKGKQKGESREQDSALDELRQKVADLEQRLDSLGSPVAAASEGSCPSGNVNIHIHGEDHEHDHDHESPNDQHVHIDLGLNMDEFHGHGFFKHPRFHGDPEEEYSAKCVMEAVGSNTLSGTLVFTQKGKDKSVTVTADLIELPAADTSYAFHVHVHGGDTSDECSELGGHYDPYDPDADIGDLGTVTTDSDKTVTQTIDNVKATLLGPYSIAGRSVILHDTQGDPMACCKIGWTHSPHDGTDDHDHVHAHDKMHERK